MYRWLIRIASWIVPHAGRQEWRVRWNASLFSLMTLVERGELAAVSSAEAASICRRAFADAFRERFGEAALRNWTLCPSFVFACLAAGLALIAVASGGFAKTRSLIETARGLRHIVGYNRGADALVAYGFPIAIALITAATTVVICRLPLRRYGWRYWTFLGGKTTALIVVLCLFWIEGGALLRAHLHYESLRVLLGAIGFALLFILLFGWAMAWSFADQRRRCPVCLKRLSLPVRMGFWSSVLEPVSTEMLCKDGHGALCLSESEISEPDHWTTL